MATPACFNAASHRLKPQSFYAVHKVAAEHYVNLCDDLDWNCAALHNLWCWDLENREQGLVKIFLSYILNGGKSKSMEVASGFATSSMLMMSRGDGDVSGRSFDLQRPTILGVARPLPSMRSSRGSP